jgi:hypothetical protein
MVDYLRRRKVLLRVGESPRQRRTGGSWLRGWVGYRADVTLRPVRYLQRTSDESSEGIALREGAMGGSERKVQAAERVGGAGPGVMGAVEGPVES